MPGKAIDSALDSIDINPKDIDGIFITHEHIDHVKGAGIISRKHDIPIYANEETWCAMEKSLGKVKEYNIKVLKENHVLIKDIDMINFSIPHDAANPIGYTAICGNKRISIATDLGCFTEEVERNIKDSNVILLESNHDVEMLKFGPYPYNLKRRILSNVGHLSNEACGNAIMNLLNGNHKNIILGHLSKTLADRKEPSSYIEF